MKFKVMALSVAAIISVSGLAFAAEMLQDAAAAPAADQGTAVTASIQVGNKICPVSGKAIGADGMEATTVEYNGKIYNLCCPGCKDQFLADAEKFSKIAEAEVAGGAQAPVADAPMADMPGMK